MTTADRLREAKATIWFLDRYRVRHVLRCRECGRGDGCEQRRAIDETLRSEMERARRIGAVA